ncbi:MAG TPA: LamB/YcsF family protein [Polyangiaceae bacterium]|nr:LamB/YcsF family protein [Polyangiaceae bacterium]
MSALAAPLFNVDAGELDDEPAELWSLAHVLHVACGGHAGDATSMRRALTRAVAAGARVGAHPSYPDREGFGRRTVTLAPRALTESLRAQCASLRKLADDAGVALTSLKPHGALYHDAARSPALARDLAELTRELLGSGASLVGPPGPPGALRDAARDAGLSYLREGFADRGYAADGALLPRSAEGALITDPETAVAQARALWASGAVDTLCVHGDNPAALPLLRALRAAFA